MWSLPTATGESFVQVCMYVCQNYSSIFVISTFECVKFLIENCVITIDVQWTDIRTAA